MIIQFPPFLTQLRRQLPVPIPVILQYQPHHIPLRSILLLAAVHKAVSGVQHAKVVEEHNVPAAKREPASDFLARYMHCVKRFALLGGEWREPEVRS